MLTLITLLAIAPLPLQPPLPSPQPPPIEAAPVPVSPQTAPQPAPAQLAPDVDVAFAPTAAFTGDLLNTWRSAQAAYDLGKYAIAAQQFERVYQASLDADMLFNVAQSYRRLHDYSKARSLYQTIWRSYPVARSAPIAKQWSDDLDRILSWKDPFADVPIQLPKAATTAPPKEERSILPWIGSAAAFAGGLVLGLVVTR